jgi:hypothetical protein
MSLCLCRGLHHVVEIDHVLQTVTELLVPNGEFWIIGEVIGRNWEPIMARSARRSQSNILIASRAFPP